MMTTGHELYAQISAKLDTNKPNVGALYNLFQFSPTGQHWITNNRIKTTIRIAINAAIDQTKDEVAAFINFYWARDTSTTIAEGLVNLDKRQFTDFSVAFGLFIGAEEEYFKYVLTMYERMKARGKSVNWTNPNTQYIEDNILGRTEEFAMQRLKINIRAFLDGINLGWMVGKGRMPKKIEVANMLLAPYRGTYKPIEWLGVEA
jgi:hypothetical protein